MPHNSRIRKCWMTITPHPEIRGQFQQHFSSSFCTRRSQKRKKTLMTWLSFALFESARVKDVYKHVGEIDYWSVQFWFNLTDDLFKNLPKFGLLLLTSFTDAAISNWLLWMKHLLFSFIITVVFKAVGCIVRKWIST